MASRQELSNAPATSAPSPASAVAASTRTPDGTKSPQLVETTTAPSVEASNKQTPHPLIPSLDLPSVLTVLVAASLALHVPTYLHGAEVSFHSALANFPSPFSSPIKPTIQITPPLTKQFGDPNDGLLGDPFDGEEDYVCDTTFRAVRIVNRDPLVMYIEGFLRKGEPEWIISKAKPLLARSSVVDVDNDPTEKRNDTSLYRTSSTAFLTRSGDRILKCIENRASVFTGVPLRNTEGLQVTYYKEGQEYKPHWDYFPREFASMGEQLKRGGQRVTTLFAYLNTVPLPSSFTGTPNSAFPPSYTPPDTTPNPHPTLIGAGSTQFPDLGVEVFPVKGAAAMWWDVNLKGEDDPRTLHAGTPPLYGEKWGLNVWQREREFD